MCIGSGKHFWFQQWMVGLANPMQLLHGRHNVVLAVVRQWRRVPR